MTVRRATMQDASWVLGQMLAFSASLATKKPLLGDQGHAARVLATLIEEHLVLVAEDAEGGRVGALVGVMAPHPFNPGLTVLSQQALWVVPSARGGGFGRALVTAFAVAGRESADWTLVSVRPMAAAESDVDSALKELGFVPTDRIFLMES